MQRLTLLTLGAAFIGVCGFVYDAAAQIAPPRPAFESVANFPQGSSDRSEYSDFAIDSVARTARDRGANSVIVQTPATGQRTKAVATALSSNGIHAVVVPPPTLAIGGDI